MDRNYRTLDSQNDSKLDNEVEHRWVSTSTSRLEEFTTKFKCNCRQFLKKWKEYDSPEGHLLIAIDFETIHKTVFPDIKIKWQLFKKIAPKVLLLHVKDEQTQRLMSTKSNLDEGLF